MKDPKDKDQDDSIIQIILVLFFATWYELFLNIKHLSRIEKGTTRWFTQPNNFAKKL